MDITLEKIELVKDRTGVSYKEAKEALEKAEGSVVDAIIAIEESIDEKSSKSFGVKGAAILEKIKELVKKGNVSKIVVSKDGETILNVPVNVGIIGTVVAPFAIIVATAATFGFKCSIEVVKDDGTVIDVSEMANDKFDGVVEKSAVIFEGVKNKSADMYETAKTKAAEKNFDEKFETVKDMAKDMTEKVKDKGSDVYETVKAKAAEHEKLENVMEKAKDVADAAKAKFDVVREANSDFSFNIAEDLEEAAEAVEEEIAEELDSTVKVVDITDKTE